MSLTIKQAFLLHAVVSAIFSLPVMILGPAGFLNLVSEGKVEISDTLLVVTGVDYCKNLLITWIGVVMQQCCSDSCLRLLAMGMVGMTIGAAFCNIAVTGWELPPPVLVYVVVTTTAYTTALMNESPKVKTK